MFDDYDAFLKQAIRDYYDRGWKSRRGNFIALVIASGQVMSMAADSVRTAAVSRRRRSAPPAWSRCASASATRSRGPLGIILTGAAAVSLAGLRHQAPEGDHRARSAPTGP